MAIGSPYCTIYEGYFGLWLAAMVKLTNRLCATRTYEKWGGVVYTKGRGAAVGTTVNHTTVRGAFTWPHIIRANCC